ncbi:hypothetical protein FUA25_07795 [Chryseobacterium sp.]|nr:hypothetical protein FUA25_07795 [Chryseobacterium sp.]
MRREMISSDAEFVESLIPQKKPFVMVDELLSFSEAHLTSALMVNEENLLVENGYFQASGILEHQAQSVALHSGYAGFLMKQAPVEGYIGSVKHFEVIFLPIVGEKLISDVEILSSVSGISMVKVTTKTNGEIMATGEIMTVLKS